MTIKVREIAGSESGSEGWDSASETRVYRVFDDTVAEPTIPDMRAAVLAVAPATSGYLVIDKLSRDFDEEGRSWLWTAEYNYKPAESTLRWSFDTQGGSIKVTHSLATSSYPGGAPNYNSAVGVKVTSTGEIEVEGVERTIPALRLSATYRWPADTFDTAAANTLASLTGCTNSATWQTYAAGELLFLGASGEIVPGKPTEVTYNFAASANATGITIGSIISIAKKGHEYLWILWRDDEDVTAKALVKKPLAAYVERIYAEVAFSSLGIG